MDFGVGYFPTHDGIGPGPLARMLEERGQAALLFAEHTHIPAGDAHFPEGAAVPPRYWHSYDLFVAMTAAACATTRLRIGSGICLVPQREPIATAKAVASVDDLSGGRVEFGVGAGWNRTEMLHHGTDPRTRMALMRERVEAMKEIWAQDEASYSGRFVSFERIRSYPKPAQRPHPPVLVGGYGPGVLDRVLAFGDAWIPNHPGNDAEQEAVLFRRVDELRKRAEDAGRSVEVQTLATPADAGVLERLRGAGVRRALTWLPAGPRSVVEPALERWERAIGDLNGE
jgi:probable F420-dependent oxidoreductase